MNVIDSDNRISQIHSLVDDLFDGKRSGNYQLAIRLGNEGISAAVWDDVYNKILASEEFAFQKVFNVNVLLNLSNAAIRQSQILGNVYKKVSLAVVNAKATLVPNALFDAGEKEVLLKFNHELEIGEMSSIDNLPNLDGVNIYAISEPVQKAFQEWYPSIRIMHFSSPLIESVLLRYKNKEAVSVVVHVQNSHQQILVVKSGKLTFYNSFVFHTAEDFVYYLLFVFEQLQLNPETTGVELMGDLDNKSQAWQLTYNYVRNVKFAELPDSFEYSFKLTSVPRHRYCSLYAQFLHS